MLVLVFPMEKESAEATGRILRSDLYFHGLEPGGCISQHLHGLYWGGEPFKWSCCQTHCPLGELKTRSMPTYIMCADLASVSPLVEAQSVWRAVWLPAHSPAITSLGGFSPIYLCCFQTCACPGQESFHCFTWCWYLHCSGSTKAARHVATGDTFLGCVCVT